MSYEHIGQWRALSFSQPWLELVLQHYKRVENRRRSLGRPKLPFILHGARSSDYVAAGEFLRSRGLKVPDSFWMQEPRRGFCGVARSLGVLQPHQADVGIEVRVESRSVVHRFDLAWWMREQFGYLLAEVSDLPVVPGKGRLGFFRVDPGIVRELGLPPTPEEYLARAA